MEFHLVTGASIGTERTGFIVAGLILIVTFADDLIIHHY